MRPGPGLWLALQVLGTCAAGGSLDLALRGGGRCQPIEIAMCRGIGYNLTRMPNLLGHERQREAALQLHQFAPLVELGCHGHLRFVLCSLYAPMCAEQVSAPIPACRVLCEQARLRCARALEQRRFRWPDALDCGRLPRENDPNQLCMEAPGGGADPLPPPPPPPPRPPPDAPRPSPPREGGPGRAGCADPGQFRPVGRGASCAPRCAPGVDVYWSREDKRFAAAWLAVWSALSFLSSAFTLLTCLVDPGRFRYPERPLVFLSLCHCASSLGYLIRLLAGAEGVACGREGRGGAGCTLVFLLLYYFGMAASLWWVVLALTWFLAAGRKWGHEAIEARSGYFHLAAWAIPAVQTALVLATRRVAGDELTGVCYVGSMDAQALTGFVLAPLAGHLALGAALLLSGFVALFRIRRAMRASGESTGKLEALTARIGLFSALHAVPAACVLACLCYERLHAGRWRALAAQRWCRRDGRARGPDCPLAASIPAAEVFLLKTFMLLAAGTTSGVWVWTAKTLQAWRALCGRRKPARAGAPGGGVPGRARPPQKARPGPPRPPAQPPACV